MNKIFLPFAVKNKTIKLGTCVHPGFMWDKRYIDTLRYFSWITPEVAGGYWWIYGSEPHGWSDMDNIVSIAEQYNQNILYHNLRWWWKDQPIDIDVWITEAMLRYPTIKNWVVVNEGWDYYGNQTIPLIDESFIIARKNRPDATLWYNGLLDGSIEQQHAIRLLQLGLADAIGIQMHLSLNSNMSTFLPLLSWLSTNNITWAITEMDVTIPEPTEYFYSIQKDRYADALNFYNTYKGKFFGVWGVGDNVSWLYNYYPLLFDREYKPKPAMKLFSYSET